MPHDAVEIIDVVLSLILDYAEDTHHLTEEQLNAFAGEILKVTIGTADRDTFLEYIAISANLQNDVARDLASKVEAQLFELLDVLQIDVELAELEEMYKANAKQPPEEPLETTPSSTEPPSTPEVSSHHEEGDDRLHKVRTMEEDAKKTVGYDNYQVEKGEDGIPTSRSSQDDLFNRHTPDNTEK